MYTIFQMLTLVFVSYFLSVEVSFADVPPEQVSQSTFKIISQERVPKNALSKIEASKYTFGSLQIKGTTFFILGRKQGGLGIERLRKAIELYWPMWYEKFPYSFPEISFIDAEQYIGAGPYEGADNVLGINLGGEFTAEIQDIISRMLAWTPAPSAESYVLREYTLFQDPLQAYANDFVVHELGHSIFGWGVTKIPQGTDKWFALGLGIIYDREIYAKTEQIPSPLFTSIVSVWKNKFSLIKEIDQRLVSPNTSRDLEFGLIRLQTYSHGKAMVYLSALRNEINPVIFDAKVIEYLNKRQYQVITYDDFLTLFNENEIQIIRKLESQYLIR